MSKQVERATEIFGPHLCNCSQAIAVAFADSVNFDEDAAMNAARGFGGGIGSHGKTCGAVTGAVMVLGIHAARLAPDEKQAKAKAYELAQAFTKRFAELHGTIECRDLIGLDLSTEEGQKLNSEKKVTRGLCPNFVQTAAEIVDEMLSRP
jgi:C_GCAxxG_C_C family probable redox protein